MQQNPQAPSPTSGQPKKFSRIFYKFHRNPQGVSQDMPGKFQGPFYDFPTQLPKFAGSGVRRRVRRRRLYISSASDEYMQQNPQAPSPTSGQEPLRLLRAGRGGGLGGSGPPPYLLECLCAKVATPLLLSGGRRGVGGTRSV